MPNRFAQVPMAEINRSSFDRSSGLKTTINSGLLYPFFVDEALPGDTFNLKAHGVARLATPLFPIMDNIYLDTFFFAVPYRLLWDNWEKFNGAQDKPGDSTDFTIPQVTIHASSVTGTGSLADYFGLPLSSANSTTFNALPFRAYNLIWNEWFRDQNLQDPLPEFTGDATVSVTGGNYQIVRRGKRHDYFTSCLPWPQKGEAVTVPLGASAPVVPNVFGGSDRDVPFFRNASGNQIRALEQNSGNALVNFEGANSVDTSRISWDTNTGLMADLSSATAVTINTLREAFQIQKILERDARGGTRYIELIKSHFGVTSPDARLQRPEYLGGYSQPVNISQVASTARIYTDSHETFVGQLAAYGTANLNGNRNGFTHSFTEHCVVIGLVAARAELTYQNQVHRSWSRKTRFDFYWPALAQIGEQGVLNKEIYFANNPTEDEKIFGYQERYAEYRYKPSIVTNLFRSDVTTSLDAWHLALDYDSTPLLNNTFIEDNPPIKRTIAVPSEPDFILDFWFDLKCARPMPMYGVPGLIDHF